MRSSNRLKIKNVSVGPFTFKIVNGITGAPSIELESLTIYLDERKPVELGIEELLHEIEHAINWVADLTDCDTEESFVRRGVPIRLDTLTRPENKSLWNLIQLARDKKHESVEESPAVRITEKNKPLCQNSKASAGQANHRGN